MGTMTKWPVQNTQNITKHGVYKDATETEITVFVFFGFFWGVGVVYFDIYKYYL